MLRRRSLLSRQLPRVQQPSRPLSSLGHLLPLSCREQAISHPQPLKPPSCHSSSSSSSSQLQTANCRRCLSPRHICVGPVSSWQALCPNLDLVNRVGAETSSPFMKQRCMFQDMQCVQGMLLASFGLLQLNIQSSKEGELDSKSHSKLEMCRPK